MIIVGAGHDNGVNDPLVLAASILATAINGAQRQQQQVSQVKNIYNTIECLPHEIGYDFSILCNISYCCNPVVNIVI